MIANPDGPVGPTIEELGKRVREAHAALDALHEFQRQVEKDAAQLESPRSVIEHIQFFVDAIARASAECERIGGELSQGATHAHVETLRRLATESADEQRRCVTFSDTFINKILPYETMRPLLNGISATTRAQVASFRGLRDVADRLDTIVPPSVAAAAPVKASATLDRRAFFRRWVRPPGDG